MSKKKQLKIVRNDYAERIITFDEWLAGQIMITHHFASMRNDIQLVFVLDEKETQELKEFLNND